MSEGAECAHFKENRHDEKDRNCLSGVYDRSDNLRRCARPKACPQIRTGDDCTGPGETQHRKNAATAADDQLPAERGGNFAYSGCGAVSATEPQPGERTATIVAGAPDGACAAISNGTSLDPAAKRSAEFRGKPGTSGNAGDPDSRAAAADGPNTTGFSHPIHRHPRPGTAAETSGRADCRAVAADSSGISTHLSLLIRDDRRRRMWAG